MRSSTRGETIQFRIPGDAKYVSLVRRAVRTLALDLGFPEDTVWDIEISVAEALANAVEHGSPDQNADAVIVNCRFDSSKLIIDVRDEGPGFALPCRPDQADCLEEGGRGLRMIYRLMDAVKVSRDRRGSRLRMIKNVSPPARSHEIPARLA